MALWSRLIFVIQKQSIMSSFVVFFLVQRKCSVKGRYSGEKLVLGRIIIPCTFHKFDDTHWSWRVNTKNKLDKFLFIVEHRARF